MWAPWSNKTGLAKTVTFAATVLLISLGLCGANFYAFFRFVPLADPPPNSIYEHVPRWVPTVLFTAAGVETLAIFISAGALLGAAFSAVRAKLKQQKRVAIDKQDSEEADGR